MPKRNIGLKEYRFQCEICSTIVRITASPKIEDIILSQLRNVVHKEKSPGCKSPEFKIYEFKQEE